MRGKGCLVSCLLLFGTYSSNADLSDIPQTQDLYNIRGDEFNLQGEVQMSEIKLDTEEAKTSYALGHTFGQDLKHQDSGLDIEKFIAGLNASFTEQESAISENEMKEVLDSYTQKMMKQREDELKNAASENLKAGNDYLAKNKNEAGVTTTTSGLQYKVINEGNGNSPKETDTVTVHYTGSLLSGQVFDSSHKAGQPVSFALNQVIPGWTEGLQLMKVGSKYEFTIPPGLAYGPAGIQNVIPPNSVLKFEVELIDIK